MIILKKRVNYAGVWLICEKIIIIIYKANYIIYKALLEIYKENIQWLLSQLNSNRNVLKSWLFSFTIDSFYGR